MSARERLRWKIADATPVQPALFDEPAEREIGIGEFRGLEFLHVRARTIINDVGANAAVPFRYTINAYRGCSHACSYCQAGETPILMADGRTKPLADVRPGEQVYGTVRRGSYRRCVTTEVRDHWSTAKPAYRITLEDGTELIASGDHRFLTGRRWKRVTGTEQGALRRPHLTVNDKLMGSGKFSSAPVADTEYRQGYLCGMIRGDGSIGHDSYARAGRSRENPRPYCPASTDFEALRRSREYLASSGAVEPLCRYPSTPVDQWRKGFLAGIFDAEGSYSGGILRISNTDQRIIDEITSSLTNFGFQFALEMQPRAKPMLCVKIVGGLSEHLRFFHSVDPAITRKRTIEGVALKSNVSLRVVSIEPLGIELPMFDITTGTGDFIANGVVSHNCFARPTHEYLNLNSGEDFERVIVVKV
ncbi:MAG: LAGLIDADG family homing endonuclease, partial [Acidimicrobiia bacterium]